MPHIDSEGYEWSTSSGETPPNVVRRRERDIKELEKKNKKNKKKKHEISSSEEEESSDGGEEAGEEGTGFWDWATGGGGGEEGDSDEWECKSAGSNEDLSHRLTPAQRRQIRLAEANRPPLKPLPHYTPRFALTGLTLTLCSFLMELTSEAKKNDLEESKMGKKTFACVFATLALFWGFIGAMLTASAGRSCVCGNRSKEMPGHGVRMITMIGGWISCFIALVINIFSIVVERSRYRVNATGAHACAGLLWLVSGSFFFMSHHVYRGGLEEFAPNQTLHPHETTSLRTKEEQELAMAVLEGQDADLEEVNIEGGEEGFGESSPLKGEPPAAGAGGRRGAVY